MSRREATERRGDAAARWQKIPRVAAACVCFVVGCASFACSRDAGSTDASSASLAPSSQPSSPSAVVSVRAAVPILPIRGWLQRIGGEHVQVSVLIRSGQSMHTFDPVPRLMTEIDACGVFFTLGLPFERRMIERLESRSKPPRVVDLRTGVELREIDVPCVHETDDPEHKHEHTSGGDKDPHIWLNPRIAAQICSTIGQTLIDIDPAHRDEYAKNLAALQSELLSAHESLRERLAPLRGSSMLVYHPDFGYFCDEYGLRQMPLELEGREPTAREISVLTEKAKALSVRAVFTQPQYSRKSADILASRIGATVVVIDPLSEDYFDLLKQLADGLLAHAPTSQP